MCSLDVSLPPPQTLKKLSTPLNLPTWCTFHMAHHAHCSYHYIRKWSTIELCSTYPPLALRLHCYDHDNSYEATSTLCYWRPLPHVVHMRPVERMNRVLMVLLMLHVHSGHSRWAWLWLPTKVHYLWCLHTVLLNSRHIPVYWSQFFNKFNSCAYNSLRCLDIQIWWFLNPQQWQWQQQQNWLLYPLHTCVGWYKHNNLVVKRIEDWVISCQDRAMHNIIV